MSLNTMLEFRYPEWVEELRAIVAEVYDIQLAEFCNTKALPKYYGLGFNPTEAFEELDEIFNSPTDEA